MAHSEVQEIKAIKAHRHGTNCYGTKAKPGMEAWLFL